MCALWNFGLAGWCLYPLARGCRAPRRMTPELAATAPAIPVWRYRLVAGAAELGGSVADRGACNNAVRGIRRVCSLEFRAGGMVSLSVGAGLPSAAPDEANRKTRRLLTNRPCLGYVYEESHSKRTSTRQQLDCTKTL